MVQQEYQTSESPIAEDASADMPEPSKLGRRH